MRLERFDRNGLAYRVIRNAYHIGRGAQRQANGVITGARARLDEVGVRRAVGEAVSAQQFGVTCSVAELVARQNGSEGYRRLDVFVAWLAVREARGESTDGIALLEKLLHNDPGRSNADRSLLKMLRNGESKDVYVPAAPLIDGSMRIVANLGAIALALEGRNADVAVRFTRKAAPRYDPEWFRSRGFTPKELDGIEGARQEIYERLGVLPVPWPDIEEAQIRMRRFIDRRDMMHGRGDFYQTCEELLVRGQRSTAQRYAAYDLASVLHPSDRVLDIGCNCGFFALRTARDVAAVDGFDIEPRFISIARIAQDRLGRDNVAFTTNSFSEFSASEPYDVIFSFAVHHWIGLPIAEYAERLRRMLKPGGLVLVESQSLITHDRDWDDKVRAFCDSGFEVVRSGMLCDDGLIPRNHLLLRDSRAL